MRDIVGSKKKTPMLTVFYFTSEIDNLGPSCDLDKSKIAIIGCI